VYFEFDAFMLLDQCGVNLDDLNSSLHGFIPLICKFGQNLAADKIWGRALGYFSGRGIDREGQRYNSGQVIVPKRQFETQFNP
jgi:hypothetical protein